MYGGVSLEGCTKRSLSFFPTGFLALRHFLCAKAARCQTRDGDLTKDGLQLHDGTMLSPRRTSALLRFSDSSSWTSFFLPCAPLLTLLPPHPDRTSSPTIALEATPFPRLPTPLSPFSRPATTPRESSVNVCSRI